MTRRYLFALLGIPWLAPIARLVESARGLVQKPDWSIDLEVESDAPLVMSAQWPGGHKERLTFPPNGSRYFHVPMYCPRPQAVKVTLESAGKFKLYGWQILAEAHPASPQKS